MARRAAHVPLDAHAPVGRVVEDLLAAKGIADELALGHDGDVGDLLRALIGGVEDAGDVVNDEVLRERAVHVEAAVRAEHGASRSDAGLLERRHEAVRVCVVHFDEARVRRRDERVVAERTPGDVRRQVAIVQIDAKVALLGALRQVEDGDHGAHRVVLVQVLPVAERPAEQVVGRAARALIRVDRRRVGDDGYSQRDFRGRGVDAHDLAVRSRREKTGHVHVAPVGRDGHASCPRADVDGADDIARRWFEREELAERHQRDVRGGSRRAHR